jgi:hypothetical protein
MCRPDSILQLHESAWVTAFNLRLLHREGLPFETGVADILLIAEHASIAQLSFTIFGAPIKLTISLLLKEAFRIRPLPAKWLNQVLRELPSSALL